MNSDKQDQFKGLKVGDYVEWSEFDPYSEFADRTVRKEGLIVGFGDVSEFVRPFIYVMVLETTTGITTPVLVHRLHKLETN